MEEIASSAWSLPLAGLLAGTLLGYVARSQRFCTMSALERYWYVGDGTGLRTWILAATSALLFSQTLQAFQLAAINESFYVHSSFAWTGAILGGLMFGMGMALVGTCGFGALVRLGGGSLRSLIVLLVLAVTALSAQKGLIAQGRVYIIDNLAIDFGFAGGQSLGLIAQLFRRGRSQHPRRTPGGGTSSLLDLLRWHLSTSAKINRSRCRDRRHHQLRLGRHDPRLGAIFRDRPDRGCLFRRSGCRYPDAAGGVYRHRPRLRRRSRRRRGTRLHHPCVGASHPCAGKPVTMPANWAGICQAQP
jgi:uncharacterized membrane protein YedE/YeeE